MYQNSHKTLSYHICFTGALLLSVSELHTRTPTHTHTYTHTYNNTSIPTTNTNTTVAAYNTDACSETFLVPICQKLLLILTLRREISYIGR